MAIQALNTCWEATVESAGSLDYLRGENSNFCEPQRCAVQPEVASLLGGSKNCILRSRPVRPPDPPQMLVRRWEARRGFWPRGLKAGRWVRECRGFRPPPYLPPPVLGERHHQGKGAPGHLFKPSPSHLFQPRAQSSGGSEGEDEGEGGPQQPPLPGSSLRSTCPSPPGARAGHAPSPFHQSAS